jgi:lysophospholipase L1-like esterase
MRLLLLGDSHLDRIRGPLLASLSALVDGPVDNRAVGGSTVHDLAGQAAGLDLAAYDAVVVSIGTNDAAPWRLVEASMFRSSVASFAAGAPGRLVLMTSPGVDEVQRTGPADSTERLMREYADLAAVAFRTHGHAVLETPSVLARLGTYAFLDDGLHLSAAAYELLLPAVAAVAAGVS